MRPSWVGVLFAAAACAAGSAAAQDSAPTPEQIYAQQKACEAKKPPRKTSGTISEGTYRKLERIIDAIGRNEFAESEKKLKELFEGGGKSAYEKAVILQTLGFVYAQTNRNAQAIKAFEDTIALNAMPQQPQEQMMFNIAQLYVADDKWDQGIKALNAYLSESCNPLPDAHILLASVYAEKKRFRESLQQVDLALVKAKTAKESWLQLKLALHYELKEYPKCAEVLLRLVALVPTKEDYWKQLQGMLFEIRKDPEALAVLALADRKGYINEDSEFRNLANLYMYLQIPLKAAQVMERGLEAKAVPPTEKNLELAANAWLAAREYDKAEKAMQRAAQASDKGELWKRLGQICIEQENWKCSMEAFVKAEQKGGVKEPGELQLLIGVAAVELKQWKRAEEALRKAMSDEKTTKQAAQWLNHLQQEYAYHNPEPVAPAEGEAEAETQKN